MKSVLKIEELLMFAFSIAMFNTLNYPWWYYWAFLLLPDLSMLGYLAGNKVGAWSYNLAHHKGVAIGFWIVGFQLSNEALLFIGILLFGHSSLDRVFGYGLKFTDDFKHTHLGWLPAGKKHKA
ncbi:MAG: DUF4260 domain-containing protein [Schleiferiaceae bacterium]|jgi:hypothetical protein|nr:DUF4260 domain-containing protein [Schleiferiaceae bacterium]